MTLVSGPAVLQLVAMNMELPLPPLGIGLIALLSLLSMMGIVLSMGKGRPHS